MKKKGRGRQEMKKKGRGRQEKKRQQDRLADIVLEKWLNAQHSASLISPPEGSTKHIKKGTKWVSPRAICCFLQQLRGLHYH
jgi:hypothetical protein